MLKNPITWLEIEEIIEDNLIEDVPFCFVCDEDLACCIVEHIEEEYGIIDDCDELFESDEYYVAVLPSTNKIPAQLFCESARGTSGAYKLNDVENMQFYIFSDMNLKDAREKLHGDRFGFFELINNEECECEDEECFDCDSEWENDSCDCGYCDDDSIQEEARIIAECLDFVFDDEESYLDCKINKIINTIYLFKDIGYAEARDIFRDFVDNLD